VVVIAHSESSLIGMLAALCTPALAFISIAGPARCRRYGSGAYGLSAQYGKPPRRHGTIAALSSSIKGKLCLPPVAAYVKRSIPMS